MPLPSRRFVRPCLESLEKRRLQATIPVYNTQSAGAWTLRSAVTYCNAGDTIDMRGITGQINLTDGGLVVDRNITILGPGSGRLTIYSPWGRAFDVAAGVNVTMSGFKIDGTSTQGAAGGGISVSGDLDTPPGQIALDDVWIADCGASETGGGLTAAFADVTMTHCRFSGNTSTGTFDALGGGVYLTVGSLVATDCTFDNNTAHSTGTTDQAFDQSTALGGGVALMNVHDSAFVNCTFANNDATADPGRTDPTTEAYGGGLMLIADGDFKLQNCTIAGNSAGGNGATSYGGGVDILGFGAIDVERTDGLKIVNTVIAGNTADAGPDAFGLDVSANGVTYFRSNLLGVGDDSGMTFWRNGNRAGTADAPVDAGLGPVADNGGAVPTMMPDADSPLLAAADPDETTRRDARGYPRSGPYEIGAVERQSNYSPGLTRWPSLSASAGTPYASSVAAYDVDGDPITFSLLSAPAWLTLTDNGDGTAALTGTPSVDDAGANTFTVRSSDGQLDWDEAITIQVDVPPVELTADGLLRVAGTDAADVIHVWQPKGTGTPIRVVIGDTVRRFSAGAVTGIQIFGRGGDDTIVGNCTDLGVYVNAGNGNDTVVGSANADTLTAAAGDDLVEAMAGDDWIDGNSGRDNLQGGDGNDRMYGGNGGDTLSGGTGRDVMYGEVGSNLYICDDHARDWVFATDPATNFVQGDTGRDLLYGASPLPVVGAVPPRHHH